jgi:hypothetical protein
VNRVVVIGVPRSGTSWVATILAGAPGVVFMNEPDYPDIYPSGGLAVKEYGLYPVLAPHESAPSYQMVWDIAFAGGFPDRPVTRRAGKLLMELPNAARAPITRAAATLFRTRSRQPEHCLVKSVYAQFALDWIADRYRPTIVVVRRNLLSVIASWLKLGFVPYDADTPFELWDHPLIQREFLRPLSIERPDPDIPVMQRIAMHVGLLSLGLERAAERHPEWVFIDHEELCKRPDERFRELFARAGLTWTDAVAAQLHDLDRPGSGVDVQRVATEQIDKWKSTLTPDQVNEATTILRRFGDTVAARIS